MWCTFLIRRFIVVSAIKEERIDRLTVKRIDVSILVAHSAMSNKGIRVERSDGFATVSMNQPIIRRLKEDLPGKLLGSPGLHCLSN